MKIAFVYSGQGAQYQGMGQEFYEANQTVRELFDEATESTRLRYGCIML